jgi:hypothetical protein
MRWLPAALPRLPELRCGGRVDRAVEIILSICSDEDCMAEDIRRQLTREDMEEAIAALDRGEPHAFGPSTFYDLLVAGRRYPPKAVVGLAARRVLGRALRPDEFSGGEESWACWLLRDRGFEVVRKSKNDLTSALPKSPPAPVWIEDTKTAAHGPRRTGMGIRLLFMESFKCRGRGAPYRRQRLGWRGVAAGARRTTNVA